MVNRSSLPLSCRDHSNTFFFLLFSFVSISFSFVVYFSHSDSLVPRRCSGLIAICHVSCESKVSRSYLSLDFIGQKNEWVNECAGVAFGCDDCEPVDVDVQTLCVYRKSNTNFPDNHFPTASVFSFNLFSLFVACVVRDACSHLISKTCRPILE